VIADIFYKENFQHAAFIESKPNVIRGNHYHKYTTQHMIITKGSLQYWYKNYNSKDDVKMIELKKGDLVTTPPLEVHALKIGPDGNEFIVFTEGLRGGLDYEKDTFRVPSIIK
jgi:quercetin dioxygenase-like cupin family protein